MPSQKDLKRLVRSRMKKTGEASTCRTPSSRQTGNPDHRNEDRIAKERPVARVCRPRWPRRRVCAQKHGQDVGRMGSCARHRGRDRAPPQGDRVVRLVPGDIQLVEPDGHRGLRTDSRIARQRAASQRDLRSEQEPYVRGPGRNTLRCLRGDAQAPHVATGKRHGPFFRSAQAHAAGLARQLDGGARIRVEGSGEEHGCRAARQAAR